MLVYTLQRLLALLEHAELGQLHGRGLHKPSTMKYLSSIMHFQEGIGAVKGVWVGLLGWYIAFCNTNGPLECVALFSLFISDTNPKDDTSCPLNLGLNMYALSVLISASNYRISASIKRRKNVPKPSGCERYIKYMVMLLEPADSPEPEL